jgi:hypothetical protein
MSDRCQIVAEIQLTSARTRASVARPAASSEIDDTREHADAQ